MVVLNYSKQEYILCVCMCVCVTMESVGVHLRCFMVVPVLGQIGASSESVYMEIESYWPNETLILK